MVRGEGGHLPFPVASAPLTGWNLKGWLETVLALDAAFTIIALPPMLGDLGYQILEATSAEETLGVVRNGTPLDVVITDHLMPGMTGSDLARTVRGLRPKRRHRTRPAAADEAVPQGRARGEPCRAWW